ncbi:MAG: formylglycine-generating enzyme family protein [Deltaproteobacteria bacterium]|nr:formylglycine-generating enzyme family protein [Deltaproteobacteria bacterium]
MQKTIKTDNMIFVPGSIFFRGCEKGLRHTRPLEQVHVDSFYIDKYPVTNEQYARIIPDWDYDPAKKNHPVTDVRYDEILVYCQKIGKRLPTEDEWEKAARGDTDCRIYPWGNAFDTHKCNCRRLLFLFTNKLAPVDAHPAGISPFGCHDMAGNVWEWTSTPIDDQQYIIKGGACSSPSKRYLQIPGRMGAYINFKCSYNGFRTCFSAAEQPE